MPCDTCVAGCCRETYVLPTGHDVFRIANTLRLPLSDFLTLRPRDKADGDFRIRLSPSSPEGGPFHRMELCKVEGLEAGYARRCVFLFTVGGRGRCGIYGVRPAQCARYPMTFQSDQPALLKRLPYCPPDAWSLSMIDLDAERLRHGEHRRNLLVHDRVIERWNDRGLLEAEGAGEAAFFEYWLSTYERLSAVPLLFGPLGADDTTPRDTIRARVDAILG